MSTWKFKTDIQSLAFCEEVANEMCRLFSIPRVEAINRINRDWAGQDLTGPDEVVYHETAEYWAQEIYYGKASCFWLSADARKEQGLPPLRPRPI